eukprot:3537048-Pyramimonas_sp.AAC.1
MGASRWALSRWQPPLDNPIDVDQLLRARLLGRIFGFVCESFPAVVFERRVRQHYSDPICAFLRTSFG